MTNYIISITHNCIYLHADAVKIKVPALEGDRLMQYLEKLEAADPEAVILRVTDPFASKRAETLPKNLPKLLPDFFNVDYCNLSIGELRKITIDISITSDQQNAVEQLTRKQSASSHWYNYRAGRVTASKFKSACSTSISKPSLSLIKTICYPSKVIFHCKEVNYGINHEKDAIRAYEVSMKNTHQNFKISDVGFVISQDTPQVGASSDALINCDCCGAGCVEVKCPWRCKDSKIGLEELSKMKDSFIKKGQDENFYLCPKHSYYFQVQLQMYVLKRTFCDFVVWSKSFIFTQRIDFDENFIKENLNKVLKLHAEVIKPELLARFYTEPVVNNGEESFCVCNRRKDEEMVSCSSNSCKIKLFHTSCVHMLDFVDGSWFCQDCVKGDSSIIL